MSEIIYEYVKFRFSSATTSEFIDESHIFLEAKPRIVSAQPGPEKLSSLWNHNILGGSDEDLFQLISERSTQSEWSRNLTTVFTIPFVSSDLLPLLWLPSNCPQTQYREDQRQKNSSSDS